MAQYVYFFGDGQADGPGSGGEGLKELLGGKGAGLAEMVHLGVPVPPGFTLATGVCGYFMRHHADSRPYPAGLEAEVAAALGRLEKGVGARFGDERNPLLVSVRSGARVSMPGMMDTVLNLGLNDRTEEAQKESRDGARRPRSKSWCRGVRRPDREPAFPTGVVRAREIGVSGVSGQYCSLGGVTAAVATVVALDRPRLE